MRAYGLVICTACSMALGAVGCNSGDDSDDGSDDTEVGLEVSGDGAQTDPTDPTDGPVEDTPEASEIGPAIDAILDSEVPSGTDPDTTPELDAPDDPGSDTEDTLDGRAAPADVPTDGDEDGRTDGDGASDALREPDTALEPFSFFVTSMTAMLTLSGSADGFGGDFGGLEGADEICQTIAEGVGFGAKTWVAFLSATDDGTGSRVNAIDRIGTGPWYDRNGRLVAEDIAGLQQDRPASDPVIADDLPDEFGIPTSILGNAHDVLTGSSPIGQLVSPDWEATCHDWTNAEETVGGGMLTCGHSEPGGGGSGTSWISSHTLRGCAAGILIDGTGPGVGDCVGCNGGYGAIYCFALTP